MAAIETWTVEGDKSFLRKWIIWLNISLLQFFIDSQDLKIKSV